MGAQLCLPAITDILEQQLFQISKLVPFFCRSESCLTQELMDQVMGQGMVAVVEHTVPATPATLATAQVSGGVQMLCSLHYQDSPAQAHSSLPSLNHLVPLNQLRSLVSN